MNKRKTLTHKLKHRVMLLERLLHEADNELWAAMADEGYDGMVRPDFFFREVEKVIGSRERRRLKDLPDKDGK